MANDEILVLKLELEAKATIKTTDDLIARNKTLLKLLKQAPVEGAEGYEELADAIDSARSEYAKNRQEILEFNKSVRQTSTDTEVYADSITGLSKKLKEQITAYENLSEAARDSFGDTVKAKINNTRAEISKLKSELKDTGETIEDTDDSMLGLSKRLKILEKEYKGLTKEQREAFGEDLKNSIADTRDELKDLEFDLKDYRRNVGNYPEQVQQNATVAKSSFLDLGNVVKGIGVAAIASLTLDTALDAAKKVAAVTKEFKELRGAIQTVTKASGEDLDSFAVSISAIATTFEEDNDRVLQAATSLTNITGDFGKSLELIETGFLTGANANGEFIDSLIEYPALIKESGASAEEFIGIISQSATSGIFSDKGIDAVKEAGIRLREQTKSTQTAVKGLFGATEGKKLLGDIETGEVSIIDAVKRVSEQIGKLPPQSKEVGAGIADIFGGAGEDASLEFIKSLKDVDGNLDKLVDTTNEVTKARIQQLASEKLLAEVQNETSKRFAGLVDGSNVLANSLQTFLFKYLIKVFDALKPLGDKLVEVASTAAAFAHKIGIVSDESELFDIVINSATLGLRILATGLSNSLDFFLKLADGLTYAYDNFTIVNSVVDTSVTVFNKIQKVLGNIPATFSGVSAAAETMVNNLKDRFDTALIDAQIFAKKLEKNLSIRSGTRSRITEEIQDLKDRRSELAAEGESLADAFNSAFDKSVAESAAKNVSKTEPTAKPSSKSSTVTGALKKAVDSGSVDALRAKVSELSKVLDTVNPDSKRYLDIAENIRVATAKLNEAEDVKKKALLSEKELADLRAAALEEKIQKEKAAAEKLRASRLSDIELQLGNAKLAAQSERDTALEIAADSEDKRKTAIDAFNATVKQKELEAEQAKIAIYEDGSLERINLLQSVADKELAIEQDKISKLSELARKSLEDKKANITLELEQAKLSAQKTRDTRLAEDSLTAKEREKITATFLADVALLELEADRKRLSLLEVGSVARIQLEQEIADKQLAIRSKLYDDDVKKAELAEQEKERNREVFIQAAFDAAQQLSDGLFSIAELNAENKKNAELQRLDDETNTKLESANLSEEQKVKIKADAEKKKEEIERAGAKKAKKRAITQAILNGFLAATAALANTTLPFPLSLTALIPVAISTGLQIANIKKQKFKKGKLFKGALHTNNGIDVKMPNGAIGEVEDGEGLLNRVSTARYIQTLSDANQAYGGVRFEGTKKLTPRRKRALDIFESLSRSAPIVAARGLSPRISAYAKRKFQNGTIFNKADSSEITVKLDTNSVKAIENAAERGTNKGVSNAKIYETVVRQSEREAELAERNNS